MTSIISETARALTMACDILCALESASKVMEMEGTKEDNYLATASLVNRLILSSFCRAPAVSAAPSVADRSNPELLDGVLALDFLSLNRIPVPLHGDAVFRRYICMSMQPCLDRQIQI